MGRLAARLAGLTLRLVLMLLGAALLAVMALGMVAAWLATLPLLRLSPRNRRLRAGLDLALALAALVAVLRPEELEKLAEFDLDGLAGDETDT